MLMNSLPKTSEKYFWDVDPKTLDSERHQAFIVERLLEQGDLESLVWINQKYARTEVQQIINQSRRLSPKTLQFCALYYA